MSLYRRNDKMKNPFNNILSFLVTLILIIILALLMLDMSIKAHRNAEVKINEIKEIIQERQTQIEDILLETEDEID